MTLSIGKAAGLSLALVAGNAFALGLGEVSGRATLGQVLHLEIPLLGGDGNVPAATCFRLRAPQAEIGNDFAASQGRIQVVGERGSVKLVVVTTAIVRDPVVGFAVAAGCDFELSRDYVLLVGLPTATPAVPTVETRSATVAPPPAEPAPAAKAAAPENLLRVDAAITLEALARQKFPAQPKAREKFMRMMRQANAGLPADDSPIAAGTELRVPPGLPQRRVGAYRGETHAAAPTAQPTAAAAEPPVAAPPRAAKPQARGAIAGKKDRLVLGAAPETNEAKLLVEAERLTAILVEQNKAQEAMTENLSKLEGRYGELQTQFTRLQDRLARIEAERLAEKQAAKSLSVDFVELLLAVLAGGALGGLALDLYRRRQARRSHAAADSMPAAAATPAPRLPWARPTEAAPAPRADDDGQKPDVDVAAPAAKQDVLDFHKP